MNEPRDKTVTPGGMDAGSVAYWKARCTRLENGSRPGQGQDRGLPQDRAQDGTARQTGPAGRRRRDPSCGRSEGSAR